MAKTKENIFESIIVKVNAFQGLSIGLEISGSKGEAIGFVSSFVSTISPKGAATGVMEPGKFVANLDFFAERRARSNAQWVTFGERKAFIAFDIDVA